ncbi:hypothetical protein ES703_94862 [subsurface metagenome]
MTAYEWGSPYSVTRRDSADPNEEIVHAQRYELVYDFETKDPLSLRQANEVFGQIIAKPEIAEGAKIKYWKIEQSSTEGQMTLQFEAKSPAITLAIIISACIAAALIAATIAIIVFIVPPFFAASYVLTTGIAGIPPILKVVLGIAFIGGVVYFGYKLTGKYIEKRREVPPAPSPSYLPNSLLANQ